MTFTECEGVRFYEGLPPELTQGEEISTTIGGVFRNAQLASLRDVKAQMADECKRRGANAIVRFAYGQKSSGILASIFARDDIKWYGRGYLATTPGNH